MQEDHIKEKNVEMDKNEICKAISHVKLEDEEEMAPSEMVHNVILLLMTVCRML